MWGYHLSHFFVNHAFPLANLFNHVYGHSDAWMTVPKDLYSPSGTNYFEGLDALRFGRVLPSPNLAADYLCYRRTVAGLNSTCACCGCHKDYADSLGLLQVRQLVHQHYLTPAQLAYVQGLAARNVNRPPLVVIVQRLTSRSLVNLPELQALLTRRQLPFRVEHMERMTFAEQVQLMSLNATIYIGAHGNAMGNAFWMPEHSLVVEVHPHAGGSGWFKHIYSDALHTRHHFQLHYFLLQCEMEACKAAPHEYQVDLGRLALLLDNYT